MDANSLIAALHSEDDEARWAAARALGDLGDAAVDPILEDICRGHLDERLCRMYLYVFEQQRTPATIERLRDVEAALRGASFRETAPVAAERALEGRPARRS